MKKLIAVSLLVAFVLVNSVTAAIVWRTYDTDVSGRFDVQFAGISGDKIVGSCYDMNIQTYAGFAYDGVTWTTLLVPNSVNTSAAGISGNTVVGGYVYSGANHGYVYDGSSWRTLDAPASISTIASGISGGKIVGSYTDAGGQPGNLHGFLYDGTAWTTLDAPGSSGSVGTVARGIYGEQVVGSYYDVTYGNQNGGMGARGFVYNGKDWVTLDAPGGLDTAPFGIYGNNIVGHYNDSSGISHGFLYNGTAWTTLDAPGATSTRIAGIYENNIVGTYIDGSGRHSFVCTVETDIVPEPSTLIPLLVVAIGGVLYVRRKR